METVKVSPKFQVVIPKRLRQEMDLQPGQVLQVFAFQGTLHFNKPRPLRELRGMAKGLTWQDEDRDHADRF